jgi:hypothetical protein
MDAASRIAKFVQEKPAAVELFGQMNQAGIRWGMFAGCSVSLLTGNRQATDVDILVHNDDFDRAASFLPVTKRTDKVLEDLVTGDGEAIKEEVSVLAVIVKGADLEFIAHNTFVTAEGQFPIFFSDLAAENRLLFEVDGHRVYIANPFDTMLFKAFLRRGPEQNKFDAKDVADLCRMVDIDKQYVAARLQETGSTPKVLAFLRQAGLAV